METNKKWNEMKHNDFLYSQAQQCTYNFFLLSLLLLLPNTIFFFIFSLFMSCRDLHKLDTTQRIVFRKKNSPLCSVKILEMSEDLESFDDLGFRLERTEAGMVDKLGISCLGSDFTDCWLPITPTNHFVCCCTNNFFFFLLINSFNLNFFLQHY